MIGLSFAAAAAKGYEVLWQTERTPAGRPFLVAKPRRVCYDTHAIFAKYVLDRVGTARQVRRDGKLSDDEGVRPTVLLPLPLPPGETPSWQLSRKES